MESGIDYGKLLTTTEAAISRDDIESLARIWRELMYIGTKGDEIRSLIAKNVNKIAQAHNYTAVNSFRELVENYDWKYLRELYEYDLARLITLLQQTEGSYYSNVFCKFYYKESPQPIASYQISSVGSLVFLLCMKATTTTEEFAFTVRTLLKNDYDEDDNFEGFNGDDTVAFLDLCNINGNYEPFKLMLTVSGRNPSDTDGADSTHLILLAAHTIGAELGLDFYINLVLDVLLNEDISKDTRVNIIRGLNDNFFDRQIITIGSKYQISGKDMLQEFQKQLASRATSEQESMFHDNILSY
jgi:hypothetical protein